MKARGAVAFAVALIAFLCAGLWLGGHPGELPEFLRDRFVGAAAGLNAEASELIEDNYFRPVGATELSNSSLQGMVRELRKRHRDRFSEYFSPESLESFNQADRRPLLRRRLSRGAGQTRPAGRPGLPGSPADRAGIEPGDTVVSVDGDSIAGESSTEATARSRARKGPR